MKTIEISDRAFELHQIIKGEREHDTAAVVLMLPPFVFATPWSYATPPGGGGCECGLPRV